MKKNIGYIGLGKMGKNMVLHLLENGWDVTAYNRSPEPTKEVEESGAVGVYSVKELCKKILSPRLIWLMVPYQAVDGVLDELTPLLEKGDIVIDGGNSNYKDTIRRANELKNKGVNYIDAGVSGGPSGARNGASVMVGGDKSIFDNIEQIFKDISIDESYGYMGDSGAGHFVKMVHNGIEYGMMQAIGEGFELMKKSPLNLDLIEVSRVYKKGTVIESRLIDWLNNAYDDSGVELSGISGEISHSGEGLWTVEAAKELGVPVDIIEGALQFRINSQGNPSYTGQIVSALRNQFGGHDVHKKNKEK